MNKALTRNISISFILILALFAAGCASQGGQDYTRNQERRAMTVQRGVVTDVRIVNVSEDSTMLGPSMGGVAGGVLGSLIGGGSGRVLGAVGGAAVGALGGAAVEKQVRDKQAYQLFVKLDSGGELAVVQDMDISFQSGDRVQVLTSSDGKTRVQH
ncbi:glycine zipper 2TM domain-containing protein [Desulfovibrio sp. OttesenSCG-928-C06]|nr:glycine zipper 2TM domain-containing protein [Desulfovibrio sp. OttesenSCG-928-C06]